MKVVFKCEDQYETLGCLRLFLALSGRHGILQHMTKNKQFCTCKSCDTMQWPINIRTQNMNVTCLK